MPDRRTTTDIPAGALDWITSRHVGLSSKAIFRQMTGAEPTPDEHYIWRQWSHPHDPDDFQRCVRLLEAVPEWRLRLGEMADRSPEWARLVARWDEIETLLNQEAPRWREGWRGERAPKAYAVIQECTRA